MNHDLVAAFVNRFQYPVTDNWLRSRLTWKVAYADAAQADPAMQLHELRLNLDRIYVPTTEAIRLTNWIYAIARGFVALRYQSQVEFMDVCMTPSEVLDSRTDLQYLTLDPEAVPIFAVHGLPGYGKSALVRALERVLPQPSDICAEGDPPQRFSTTAACWIHVNTNFSLLNWVKEMLAVFGTQRQDGRKNLGALSRMLYKAFYRTGVAVILVDELQFASGRTSARRAISQLLAMRNFGVPIIFFANTDFIEEIRESPAQISQRIPRDVKMLAPIMRNDPVFQQILEAQLNLHPYGHDIDTNLFFTPIYDMTAGSPRASGRLIELASHASIQCRRKLSFNDLVAAQKSGSFEVLRRHIALLRSPIPVDNKKYPELASNNELYDPADAYREQMQNDLVADTAALGLYSSYSDDERELADAIEIEILRRAGKIGENVKALGEASRKRATKKELEERFLKSFVTKRLANITPKNPVSDDESDSQPQ